MEYNFSDRLKTLEGNAIREIFSLLSRPGIISFAGGFPAKETLPVAEIGRITADLLENGGAQQLLQYGGTEGYSPLLESALEYARRTGIRETSVKNALIISGGQQGIDLVFKAFLNKGDAILVEDPTYLASLHILKTYEGRAYGVKSDDDGLNIEDLEKKIKAYKPKILYVVANFSNPTGKTLSLEKRKAIAALTAKYGVIVIEDDPYGELRFAGERLPSIKSMDADGNVVYVTSFSKTIAPGLRTGIAVADEQIIRKMTIGKQATDVHTSTLSQAIIDGYLRRGLLNPHLKEIIPVYKTRKDAMINAIRCYMPQEIAFTDPDGGLFLWGEFQNGFDVDGAFKEAVAETQTAYVSGRTFFASGDVTNTFRLNYSMSGVEQIDIGIKRLADFFKKKIAKKIAK
ncbi:MAG: PLP-dependent aminotransferase family protein [Clostridiaceae bacterium]|jgi:2-aminoadipate transaminase|nr:PLP-dependent aminotransferase family protein [Clostridiaceae bacterium]